MKIILGILLAYVVSVGVELPVKRYFTQNPNAYVTVSDVILAPLVVPTALGIKFLEGYSAKCAIGCK